MQNIRAAAVQMISSTNPDVNIETMKRLVHQAAEQGADWVLLPEYWPLMGRKDTDKLAFAEPLVGGNFSETRCARFGETRYARFQTTLSETAAECGVVLFGGTIPLQSPDEGKVMNTMLVYDRDGTQIGLYHKMHLFGFSGLGERYAEADTISAGGDVPKLAADGVPPAAFVLAALRRSDDVALVFHCAGAQQQFPMRFACRVSEGGGQQQNVKRLLGAEKLGKTQVVAHACGKRHAVGGQFRYIATRTDGVRLGIAFTQA